MKVLLNFGKDWWDTILWARSVSESLYLRPSVFGKNRCLTDLSRNWPEFI